MWPPAVTTCLSEKVHRDFACRVYESTWIFIFRTPELPKSITSDQRYETSHDSTVHINSSQIRISRFVYWKFAHLPSSNTWNCEFFELHLRRINGSQPSTVSTAMIKMWFLFSWVFTVPTSNSSIYESRKRWSVATCSSSTNDHNRFTILDFANFTLKDFSHSILHTYSSF